MCILGTYALERLAVKKKPGGGAEVHGGRGNSGPQNQEGGDQLLPLRDFLGNLAELLPARLSSAPVSRLR